MKDHWSLFAGDVMEHVDLGDATEEEVTRCAKERANRWPSFFIFAINHRTGEEIHVFKLDGIDNWCVTRVGQASTAALPHSHA